MTSITLTRLQIEPKILDELKQAFDNTKDRLSRPFFKRYEWDIDPVDLIDLHNQIEVFPKTYFKPRDNGSEILGIAQALAQETKNEIDEVLANMGPNTKIFLGGRFDKQQPVSSEWESFGKTKAILPLVEISRMTDKWTIALNIVGSKTNQQIDYEQATISKLVETITHQNSPPKDKATLINKTYTPDKTGWYKITQEALTNIRCESFKKVVLARQLNLTFDKPFDPSELLTLLGKQPLKFVFSVSIDQANTFLGASPELLFSRKGTQIRTEAIAGTRHRDQDQTEDIELETDLLKSPKDREEHFLVCDAIKSNLGQLCQEVTSSPHIEILKLPTLQHLIHQFRGELKENKSDWDILNQLHPTPAVGGYPHHPAIEFLRQQELFDRGWYAAPLGYLGADESIMAVGIRCLLVSSKDCYLYSGAGIVEASISEKEWDELDQKTSLMLKLMGQY